MVVNSELVQLLDVEQLRGVFAHEAGHVLSDHVLYRTALVILMRLSVLPGIPVPLFPLRTALMEWFRAAELSCDRAAALVTRDPLAVCRTLMVLAAGAEAGEPRPRRVHASRAASTARRPPPSTASRVC